MTSSGLTSGAEYLRNAAQDFFKDLYGNPTMHTDSPLNTNLRWTPALRFTIYGHINVFVEVSESSPYPTVLKLRVADVRNIAIPIAIYSVCPENVYVKQKREAVQLQKDGFGLITVNSDGIAHKERPAIPIVQIISKSEFQSEITGLPVKFRRRLSEAFEDYANNPVNGVRYLTEIVEGMVMKAGQDAVNKGILTNSALGTGIASTLDAMNAAPRCSNARAAIGGVRSYVQRYRNLTHHWPKNNKDAYRKYSDCRHQFKDGLKQIQSFRKALRNLGLSGGLR